MQHLLLLEFVKNALSRPDTNIFQGSFDDEKFGLLEKLTLRNNNRELSVQHISSFNQTLGRPETI